ncbi:metallophosphoesterase family protein [Tenggerimyces flavus]|uniref:Metallophosphoesterase n=1 Tax=Tenggerimyces flavus TaxID=1708749 RepID=A0ABV7Y7J0_9ACTN|nr:metallophosphoesterase [Tenggerimyces flavus]MBM7785032.1 putative MPP superfamily phosphohydrolase [Tenggerimyces flavus]
MADVTERTHRGRDAVRRWRARFRIAGRFLDKPVKILALIVLAGVGATLGMVFGGVTHPSIGPVETTMRIAPSWNGESVVELPPLGTISIDSHDGPLRLEARVDRINQADAEALFKDPAVISNLPDTIGADLRTGVVQTAVRGGVAAVLGAAVMVLIVVRRWRLSLVAGGVALVLVAGSGIAAGTTYDPRAITEPKYTGLLTSAPSLIGNASDIAENLDEYQEELTRLVTNVTRLYDVTSTLPAYRPRSDVIRLLHVSDLHIMPYSWQLIASVVKQYQVDLVVDSGDISDHGLAAENAYLDPIKKLGVPYVWVRGNHDSLITEQAMRKIKNAVVLDGHVREVSGIRFLGAGDPRFTPDRSHRDTAEETEAVARQALSIAKVASRERTPPDMIVYHDSAGAQFFDGSAPLLLTGHGHKRLVQLLPGGSRLMQEGSTGGSGLRAIEAGPDKPLPIEMSVLYLDRSTRALEAWDEITIGGLGLRSVQIERHQVFPDDLEKPVTPTPIPTPSGPVPETPLPAPTITLTPLPSVTPSVTPGATSLAPDRSNP